LAGFIFEHSLVDQRLVQLATGEFSQAANNVVLLGGPGTDKTHLATAIGVNAITQHAKRVRFYSTVDLVNVLEQEQAQDKAARIAANLLRMDMVILDELGICLSATVVWPCCFICSPPCTSTPAW
jgi:DNA replication protein DnaC